MMSVRQLVAISTVMVVGISAAASQALGQGVPPEPDPVTEAGCTRVLDYAAAPFEDDSDVIDHPLLPLDPGTQRVFVGRSNATGALLPHRVSFTATGLTKVVDGIRGRVVWDVDESNGRVAEAELAIFAQDADGNVWNLGEYPEEYPGGVFRGAPNTWFGGVGGAEPGVHMLETPVVGTPEYLQGWVPEIDFLDCGTIFKLDEKVCDLPFSPGCLSDVLVVKERSPLDFQPGVLGPVQVKYHAPGYGIVQIGAENDPENETLVLAEHNILDPDQLQAANREAHILDQRAIQCSDVYAETAAPGATSALEGPDNGDYGPYTCAVPETPATGGSTTPAPFVEPPPAASASAPPAGPQPPPQLPPGGYVARVDHPLFPLSKLSRMRYKGSEDGERIRIDSRVRSRRVRVAGARATAVDVTERENGKVVERTTDYFAQDRKGNVWYLGERVDKIKDGRVVDHDGQWIAGRRGAKRGLFMPARPRVGRSFRQTRAPGVSQDRSTVVAVDAAVKTRAGRFTGCLKTRDDDLRGRGPAERKFYCPGAGLVREQPSDGRVDLVRFR